MDRGLFMRIIVVVVIVVALSLIIGPLFALLGFPLSGNVALILKVCVAAIAVLYIIQG